MSKEDAQRLGEYKRIEKIGEGKPNITKVFCLKYCQVVLESYLNIQILKNIIRITMNNFFLF